jgi:hypothetical protein
VSDALNQIIDALDEDIEAAPGRLLARQEFKTAKALLATLREDHDALVAGEAATLVDRIREAEAVRDLLALARDEELQAADGENRLKRDMRQEDEAILANVESELKVYGLMIGIGFVLPLILVAPLGTWCAVALAPIVWGFARLYKATVDMQGRTWVLFMDNVDQVNKKVRFAHGMAVGSAVLVVMWFVFALLRREVEGG